MSQNTIDSHGHVVPLSCLKYKLMRRLSFTLDRCHGSPNCIELGENMGLSPLEAQNLFDIAGGMSPTVKIIQALISRDFNYTVKDLYDELRKMHSAAARVLDECWPDIWETYFSLASPRGREPEMVSESSGCACHQCCYELGSENTLCKTQSGSLPPAIPQRREIFIPPEEPSLSDNEEFSERNTDIPNINQLGTNSINEPRSGGIRRSGDAGHCHSDSSVKSLFLCNRLEENQNCTNGHSVACGIGQMNQLSRVRMNISCDGANGATAPHSVQSFCSANSQREQCQLSRNQGKHCQFQANPSNSNQQRSSISQDWKRTLPFTGGRCKETAHQQHGENISFHSPAADNQKAEAGNVASAVVEQNQAVSLTNLSLNCSYVLVLCGEVAWNDELADALADLLALLQNNQIPYVAYLPSGTEIQPADLINVTHLRGNSVAALEFLIQKATVIILAITPRFKRYVQPRKPGKKRPDHRNLMCYAYEMIHWEYICHGCQNTRFFPVLMDKLPVKNYHNVNWLKNTIVYYFNKHMWKLVADLKRELHIS